MGFRSSRQTSKGSPQIQNNSKWTPSLLYSWPSLALPWLESHVKRTRDHQELALPHVQTSVHPLALQSVVYQPLHHHHHHHHHAQQSVSPSVSQHAQLPVAHRRSIRKWTYDLSYCLEWFYRLF